MDLKRSAETSAVSALLAGDRTVFAAQTGQLRLLAILLKLNWDMNMHTKRRGFIQSDSTEEREGARGTEIHRDKDGDGRTQAETDGRRTRTRKIKRKRSLTSCLSTLALVSANCS